MTKKSKTKQRVFNIVFMFLVTLVFISGVSFAYLSTRQKVLLNEKLYLMRGILESAGIAVPESEKELGELYKDCVEEKTAAGESFYRIREANTGKPIAYVFIQSGPGLWGRITAAIGIKEDGKSLLGVVFLEQNETPGLGGRITEPRFCNQFKGKMGPFQMVPEGEPTRKNEFDAITGATITSNAVRRILNRTLEKASQIIKEENQSPEIKTVEGKL